MKACPHCGRATNANPEAAFEPSGPDHHDYPVHYPQQDLGHASGRAQPPFAPAWFLARHHPTPDGHGLLRE